MSLDKILMIPHLSKELDLIGHTVLPYNLVKRKKNKKLENDEETMKIVFDSKKMLDALISVCFELLKQVKTLGFDADDHEIDKVKFENSKLEKQLKLSKSETERKLDDLAAEKEANRQLKEKIEKLEAQVRNYEVDIKKISRKSSINEDVLKHNLKKKETDLEELHKVVWKQFNMADRNFFPKNFEIIQLDQPDFNKLWSEVKYSSVKTKEEALKKAVCKFQENNQTLMENNFLLKTLLLLTLEEITETYNLMFDKMLLNETQIQKYNLSDVFKNLEVVDVPMYKNILNEHFKIYKKVCELFETARFSVSDDLFICWSDVVSKLKDWMNSESV